MRFALNPGDVLDKYPVASSSDRPASNLPWQAPCPITTKGAAMSTTTYAGKPVDVNDEGFFIDPGQWTEDSSMIWLPAARSSLPDAHTGHGTGKERNQRGHQ